MLTRALCRTHSSLGMTSREGSQSVAESSVRLWPGASSIHRCSRILRWRAGRGLTALCQNLRDPPWSSRCSPNLSLLQVFDMLRNLEMLGKELLSSDALLASEMGAISVPSTVTDLANLTGRLSSLFPAFAFRNSYGFQRPHNVCCSNAGW